MSLFPWALIFVGLLLMSLGVFVLVGLRLWRRIKALAGDVATAEATFTRVWSATQMSDRD